MQAMRLDIISRLLADSWSGLQIKRLLISSNWNFVAERCFRTGPPRGFHSRIAWINPEA